MNRNFLIIIFGIFLISCANAIVYEPNAFKYGVINDDGTTSDTTTTISNVNVMGYVCANSDCSSFSGTLWNGDVLTGDQITLTYPTPQSSYGYAIYMYREGYRTYERMGVTWYGEGNAPLYTNYLRKMQSGESSVNDLDVSVSGNNLDVVVNVQSPLEHIGPLSYFPPQLIDYYSAKVDVVLEVTNSLGAIIYTETKTVSIEYSHDKNVDFTATIVPGNYDVRVYTKLDNESKVLSYTIDEEIKSNVIIPYPDADGDGYTSDVDCNDNNVTVWQLLTGYLDADGDGYGVDPLLNVCSGNSLPFGYVTNNDDLDDTNALINLYLDKDGDGYTSDVDCNDNNVLTWQLLTGYVDSDGDGYGINPLLNVCSGDDLSPGYVDNNDDLDDTNPLITIFPDADGDGYTSNVDCNDNNVAVWQLLTGYLDADGDSYGINHLLSVCSGNSLPIGYVNIDGDCNDGNSLINPGAVEICENDVDENCDGVDEICVVDLTPTITLFSANNIVGDAPLEVEFNCQATGGDGVLVYSWDFGNGDNSNLQEVSYTYIEIGNYTATCTVTDEDGDTDSESIGIEVTEVPVATTIEIIGIEGFDFVVEGKNQAIRIFVKNDLDLPETGVDIDVYYSDNSLFGSCVTEVTGGCAVEVEQVAGDYEVYAVASKDGLAGDSSGVLRFSYSVLEKVYDIVDLAIYGDDGEKTEFYRGENLLVSFGVEENGVVAEDIVANASLVNLGTGENYNLAEISNEDGKYIYGMVISYGPEFLGNNQLFAFAFNFVDGSGGQAEATLTILNNAPEIRPIILNQSLREGQTKNIDLSTYEYDAEDTTENLRWEVDDGLTKISVILVGKILTIKGVDVGEETIILRLYDSDGGFDEQIISVKVTEKDNDGGSNSGNGGSSRTVSVGFIGDGADKEVLDFETKTIPLGAEAIALSDDMDLPKDFEIPLIVPILIGAGIIILFLWVIVRII